MENVGRNVTSTWTVSVDVSLSTCTSTGEVAAGNTRGPCDQMLSIQLQYSIQCFVNQSSTFDIVVGFFVFFLHPAIMWGNFAVRSNQTLLLPWSNRTANGGHRQRRGNERGPISLLTTDFIPCVKGLLSVTFTWFKSLTQLNQKSMKSLGYIFGLSCQHFKLNTIFQHLPSNRKSKKNGEHRRGWNLTTHWKILPIAVMGLCRNGKYTPKFRRKFKKRQPILTKTLLVINFMRDMDKYSINSCCSPWYKHSSASMCMTSNCIIIYTKLIL